MFAFQANSYFPFQQVDVEVIEPSTGMVKSRSSSALAARRRGATQRMSDPPRASMIEPLLAGNYNNNNGCYGGGMTREPISVPNFRSLALPTPILTPVEAARLVFVDPDEDTDDEYSNHKEPPISQLIELPEEEKRLVFLFYFCQYFFFFYLI